MERITLPDDKFVNLPADLVKDVMFKLSWRDAFKYCNSKKRIRNLCNSRLWRERIIDEFGQEDEDMYPYENEFLNYLTARARYLRKKWLDYQLGLELLPDKDQLGFYPGNHYTGQQLSEIINNINDALISQNYEPIGLKAESSIEKVREIMKYLKFAKEDNEAKLKISSEMENEIAEIKSILTKYLRKTYPSSFLIRKVPYKDWIGTIHSSFKDIRDEYLFKPDDLVVFVNDEGEIMAYLFYTESGAKPKYELIKKKHYFKSTTIFNKTFSIVPSIIASELELFKKFIEKMGIDEGKLYIKSW